jgi:hypothetical protein
MEVNGARHESNEADRTWRRGMGPRAVHASRSVFSDRLSDDHQRHVQRDLVAELDHAPGRKASPADGDDVDLEGIDIASIVLESQTSRCRRPGRPGPSVATQDGSGSSPADSAPSRGGWLWRLLRTALLLEAAGRQPQGLAIAGFRAFAATTALRGWSPLSRSINCGISKESDAGTARPP